MPASRSHAALDPGRSVVEQLRERVAAMERRPAAQPVATLPGIADLVPLQAGATYAVDSASLGLALAAGASRAGEWVGFAGCPDFGAEAAAELGIELSRTVLVPDPGEHWLEVTAALVDVLRVVVLRPPASVDERTCGDPRLPAAHALGRARGVGPLAAGRGPAQRRGVRLERAGVRRRAAGGAACPRRRTPRRPAAAARRPDVAGSARSSGRSWSSAGPWTAGPGEVPMRVLVVWCPDWSVVAALDEAEQSPRSPAAVLSANVVEVCNGAARAEGVRRGQRRRDAQARCPELVLLPANPDRDARAFEPVLATVEELRPGVAALRPGLLAVRAPGSWYGSETAAAATVCQALVESGVWDVRVGIADDLFTAEQAARTAEVQSWVVVPAGGSAAVPARAARRRAQATGRRVASW